MKFTNTRRWRSLSIGVVEPIDSAELRLSKPKPAEAFFGALPKTVAVSADVAIKSCRRDICDVGENAPVAVSVSASVFAK